LRAKAPRRWIPTLGGSATIDLLPTTAIRDQQQILRRDRQWLDAIPFRFPLAAELGASKRRDCGRIRLELLPEAVNGKKQQPPTYRLLLPPLRRGIYKVKARVQGRAARFGPFERVLLKTVVVP